MERKAASGTMLLLLLTNMLMLTFNIQTVKASGTIYIRADGSIDPSTTQIQRDGDTYTFTADIYDSIVVEKDNIIVEGYGYKLQGTGAFDSKGIDLFRRSNVTIKNIELKAFYYGIWLSHSSNNTISKNNVTENRYSIYLFDWSSDNVVSQNNIVNNEEGVFLYWGSNDNVVSGNNISNNRYRGVDLAGSSNNAVSGNDIAYNHVGVKVFESSYNEFRHNDFIGNSLQVYDQAWDQPWLQRSLNIWDDGYTSGGNYWSDYEGVDFYGGPNQDYPSGSDGLGDSPYVIDANNRDKYPLMSPWVERTVGVKVGFWAKYKYEFSWSSTDPNEQLPQDLVDFVTHLEWYGINVLEVFDTTVAFQTVIHFKNGTEIKSQWTVDINNGSGNGTYLIAFIAAGLNPGETLCTFPPQFTWCGWEIEETISRPYAGVMRETNHLNVTNWSFHGRYPPLEFNSVDDFYWDRATGIICEDMHQQSFEREGYVTALSWTMKMVGTNIWKSPIVPATLDIDPDTLNLKSKGRWITAYIELPEGYDVTDINVSSILLNETISAKPKPTARGDYENDNIPDLMVKFNRAEVTSYIIDTIGFPESRFTYVTLTITGQLNDGTPFTGSDTIKIITWMHCCRTFRSERYLQYLGMFPM